ncbi:MAG: alpha/beta hydrolase [Pseudomonadales bacterium]
MALLGAGCSPLALINLSSPNWQQTRHVDLAFGDHERLQLDVYAPADHQLSAHAGPRPVIVFFYGGSWQRGSKDAYRFSASQLTRQGFVVVVPDYRLFPEVVFPGFIEDAAEAVRWTMNSIEEYGGDPDQVFLMGHSAGAHIAALLHYDPQYLAGTVQPPAGLIGLSGPYDFLPLSSPTLAEVFPESLRAASQPINFANGGVAPALLLHGGKDDTVGAGNSIRLAREVIAAGGSVETRIYDKRGHAGVLLALAGPLRALAPVVTDVTAFINARSAQIAEQAD